MKEAPVIHGVLIREKSLVRVNEGIKGFPQGGGSPFARVVRLKRTRAILNVDGVEREAPLNELMYCRRKEDRVDTKGRLLEVGMKVKIASYGGVVRNIDVGGEGVILKMGKETAKVKFTSDYEKVKNIPFGYLWLPDYSG
jgi:hypothetical protein